MAVVEIVTFKLAGGTDEAAFLEADRRVQTEFIPRHRGLMRRTTARGADGEGACIVLWGSAADADASAGLAKDHPVTKAFDALLDRSTVQRRRYETLD